MFGSRLEWSQAAIPLLPSPGSGDTFGPHISGQTLLATHFKSDELNPEHFPSSWQLVLHLIKYREQHKWRMLCWSFRVFCLKVSRETRVKDAPKEKKKNKLSRLLFYKQIKCSCRGAWCRRTQPMLSLFWQHISQPLVRGRHSASASPACPAVATGLCHPVPAARAILTDILAAFCKAENVNQKIYELEDEFSRW